MTTEIGGRGEPVYRIWSIVPATAAVALIAWWAWRRISPFASVIVVLLVMASPLHLELAPQARATGSRSSPPQDSLSSAVRAAEERVTSDVVLFAAFGLIGIWTLPVFVLAFLAQGAVLVASPKVRRRAVVAIAAVGAASLLWYRPAPRRCARQLRPAVRRAAALVWRAHPSVRRPRGSDTEEPCTEPPRVAEGYAARGKHRCRAGDPRNRAVPAAEGAPAPRESRRTHRRCVRCPDHRPLLRGAPIRQLPAPPRDRLVGARRDGVVDAREPHACRSASSHSLRSSLSSVLRFAMWRWRPMPGARTARELPSRR